MGTRGFRKITEKRIRCESFASVSELELDIDLNVARHNVEPKPFILTAGASVILANDTHAKRLLPRPHDKHRRDLRTKLGADLRVYARCHELELRLG
jgi:hypothetical protein